MKTSELWERIARDDKTGCWVWTGAISSTGYGNVRYEGKNDTTHAVFYRLLVGPVPAGMQLDHLCRNRPCVNPDHLEPVTQAENQRRSPLTLATRNAAKTHCPSGHPYDEPNTIVRYVASGRPRRACRTCKQASDRAHRANLRAARASEAAA